MTDKDPKKDSRIPDTSTREIAVYGTKYKVVKKSFYNIDKMIDWLESRNLYLKEKELDINISRSILTECPEAITMRDEDVPVELIKDVRTLREYSKNFLAIKTLNKWKVEIDLWGRYHGSAAYGQRMVTIGIPEDVWKVSSNMMGRKPIAFSTLQEVDNV